MRADATLSLSDDRGIVEYVPGDLTLTARAGTRLSEISAATAAHGQWLPLDPWGGDNGTIGATVSTASTGPYGHAMGLPRDVVLGLEFVTGTGEVVRSGGRVVKNVAGFDLTRLLVGSWGTLGVISEVTVRLRATPERTHSVAIAIQPSRIDDLSTSLRALPFTPLASELVNAALASRLGVSQDTTLVLRLGGNERSIPAQLDLLGSLGRVLDIDDDVWTALRAAVVGVAVWRLSRAPAEFGAAWRVGGTQTQGANALVHGNPARGVVRCVVADGALTTDAVSSITAFDGTTAIETLPADAWGSVDWAPVSDPISRAIKSKFDPAGILNPGILGPS